MTLDTFITEQLSKVETFKKEWLKLHSGNKEIYPLEMGEGDWHEQMDLWAEASVKECQETLLL